MDRERRRIGITGAGGLVARPVLEALRSRGDEVWSLVRRTPGENEIFWDPEASVLNPADLTGLDAILHLAGEPIAAGRWNSARKQRIRESRVHGTRLLAESLAELPRRPATLVCASATGYYGERGSDPCIEGDPPGDGFLAQVCEEWEGAAGAARLAGIRTVHLRIGMVLAKEGGALASMLPAFRFGLGGPLGHGHQYWNWIELQDLTRVILLALDDPDLEGPVNAVAPESLSSRDFALELGHSLRRPARLPVPAFALRPLLGEMADALLLTSTRAVPQALLDRGFAFQCPTLSSALDRLLG